VCMVAATAQGGEEGISVQSLLRKLEAAEDAMGGIEARIREYHIDLKDDANPILFADGLWRHQFGREYYDVTRFQVKADGSQHIERNVLAYDGQQMQTMDVMAGWQGAAGGEPGGVIKPLKGETFRASLSPATFWGYDTAHGGTLSGGRAPLSQALSRAENVRVVGRDTINGREVILIEAEHVVCCDDLEDLWVDARVWVDPAQGYMPIQITKSYHYNDKHRWQVPQSTVQNIEYTQVDGIWVPISGDRVFHMISFHPPEGMSQDEFEALPWEERLEQGEFKNNGPLAGGYRRLEVDVDSIKVRQDFPREAFQIDYPMGAVVFNTYIGKAFVIGQDAAADEALRDVLDPESLSASIAAGLDNAAEETELPVTTAGSQEDIKKIPVITTASGDPRILWAIGAMLLALLIGGVYIQQRQRKA